MGKTAASIELFGRVFQVRDWEAGVDDHSKFAARHPCHAISVLERIPAACCHPKRRHEQLGTLIHPAGADSFRPSLTHRPPVYPSTMSSRSSGGSMVEHRPAYGRLHYLEVFGDHAGHGARSTADLHAFHGNRDPVAQQGAAHFAVAKKRELQSKARQRLQQPVAMLRLATPSPVMPASDKPDMILCLSDPTAIHQADDHRRSDTARNCRAREGSVWP